MKKIGIITINDDSNYGCRLQNYAVQEYLKKYGFTIETIRFEKNKSSILKKRIRFLKYQLVPIKRYSRVKLFHSFNRKIRIKYKQSVNTDNYYRFFVGSDQVWNPCSWWSNPDNYGIFLLDFAPPEKRCSFSASFGVSNIPNQYIDFFQENLLKFNCISVREATGVSLVKQISGRNDAVNLLDPVFLLDSGLWNKMAKKPKYFNKNKKFIVLYFLGTLSTNRLDSIYAFAQKNSCEVIDISSNGNYYSKTGPQEFLWLIKNAFAVCTDSFHASAFSIIFNKPMYVFFKIGGNGLPLQMSRLTDLLKKFKQEVSICEDFLDEDAIICDYSLTSDVLKEERTIADKFIKKCLNIES